MDELAGLLRRERMLLEMVLFRLVELRHVLRAGESRFLAWAADEVERATSRLRESELHRAVVVNRLASDTGVAEEQLSLRTLANTSPEPYSAIFADHRRAFLLLTTEVQSAVAGCLELSADGLAVVDEVLRRVMAHTDGGLAAPTSYPNPVVVGRS